MEVPEEGLISLGPGVVDTCEPPEMGAANGTRSSRRMVHDLNRQPSPQPPHLHMRSMIFMQYPVYYVNYIHYLP